MKFDVSSANTLGDLLTVGNGFPDIERHLSSSAILPCIHPAYSKGHTTSISPELEESNSRPLTPIN